MDDLIIQKYKNLDSAGLLRVYNRGDVPKFVIEDIRKWLKSGAGKSIKELRGKVYLVCIRHKFKEKEFWQHIQGWSEK